MYTLRFPGAIPLLSRRTARAGQLLALLAALTACEEEQLAPSRSEPRSGTAERAVASAAGRPNIVVIMTDDQVVESMRVMPQTRGLIGSAGVTFDKSMVTYALCCPSRATFLTGQYPHNHGVRSNSRPEGGHAKLDHSNTLPVWLQGAGYVTGHVGKYLNGYGIVDSLEIPPGWTEWYAGTSGDEYNYYNYAVNENGTVVRYGATPDDYQADVYTGKALDFIHRRAPNAAAGTTPFFLFVTYLAPHNGGPVEPGDPSDPNLGTPVPAPRHKGRFAGEVLPASPAFNEADMSDKPVSMRNRALLTTTQVSEIREAYRQRLESLLAVDEGVARIIGALQNDGVLDNTLVIFTSDNGYFHGEHRLLSGKTLPYEPAVKVPLLIRGPGTAPGRRVSALVANIDLAPTIVEAAGVTARRTMDGRSLWPFLSGGQTAWSSGTGPRHVLVEDSPSGGKASIFWSIKRGKYVYTEYANGDRELYDLLADSAQVTSRHASQAYAKIRRKLANRLAAMKTCSGPTACW
jgi:arylsulfatase A-like enzyme